MYMHIFECGFERTVQPLWSGSKPPSRVSLKRYILDYANVLFSDMKPPPEYPNKLFNIEYKAIL